MYTGLECYSLEMLSDCMNVIVYTTDVPYAWLKCYLSGDALHGSGSRIIPIKRYRCCVTSYSQTPLVRYNMNDVAEGCFLPRQISSETTVAEPDTQVGTI